MSDEHSELKKQAIDAIDELFSDTSVSKEKTIDSLEELVEHIEDSIMAIRADIKNEMRS
jgi:polyhydroxyalkanoate synthesis regulator phasin